MWFFPVLVEKQVVFLDFKQTNSVTLHFLKTGPQSQCADNDDGDVSFSRAFSKREGVRQFTYDKEVLTKSSKCCGGSINAF